MDEKIFCQSCGMPMTQEAHFATNADGSRNNDYCCYCYDKGAFKQDCTMEEMIDCCVKIGQDMGMYLDPEQARSRCSPGSPRSNGGKGTRRRAEAAANFFSCFTMLCGRITLATIPNFSKGRRSDASAH